MNNVLAVLSLALAIDLATYGTLKAMNSEPLWAWWFLFAALVSLWSALKCLGGQWMPSPR